MNFWFSLFTTHCLKLNMPEMKTLVCWDYVLRVFFIFLFFIIYIKILGIQDLSQQGPRINNSGPQGPNNKWKISWKKKLYCSNYIGSSKSKFLHVAIWYWASGQWNLSLARSTCFYIPNYLQWCFLVLSSSKSTRFYILKTIFQEFFLVSFTLYTSKSVILRRW